MILKLISKAQFFSNHSFYVFLILIGISIVFVSELCLKSFPFTIPLFLMPSSSSNSSLIISSGHDLPSEPPLISPLSPPPPSSTLNSSLPTISGHDQLPEPPPIPPLSPPPPPPTSLPPYESQPQIEAIPSIATSTNNSLDVSSVKNNYGKVLSEMSIMHNMSDDELLLKASQVQVGNFKGGKLVHKKVAFMFLTPGPLPLSPLWDMFFKGHEGLYSIYVHPHPSYNESSFDPNSSFYGRRIPSQPVTWGTISMIDAERRLLANALLDSSNQRFVLLSDTCIPLFNFTIVYNYLMGTNTSFLSSYDDPGKTGRGRYKHRMWRTITIDQWRKGSQWFEINRDLATKIISDATYYPVFNQFCPRGCYSDEHYLPTFVNILYPEMNSNRSVTWVDWSRGGAHPRRYRWFDINMEELNNIRFGSECVYNGNVTNICHLFARKFMPNTLRRLLKLAPSVLGFDP